MEKLSDLDLQSIAGGCWEDPDMVNMATDLLSTRAELAACQKNLSDLCPIADMPVIESLKAEKLAMMEELAALQDKGDMLAYLLGKCTNVRRSSQNIKAIYEWNMLQPVPALGKSPIPAEGE